MISLNLFMLMLMFVRGCLSYSLKRKHLLRILIRLEFVVVSLFLLLVFYLSRYNYEFFFSIIFLTFRVCEGALGLSILVRIIRTHGNDYFNSFRILQ